MSNYLSPGVYVEDVPSMIKPIAGVGTSIAAFVGNVDSGIDMPVVPGTNPETNYPLAAGNKPVKITSWENFKKNFGDFETENSELAHAVYGFFNNGGTTCWVVRVLKAADDATADEYEAALNTLKTIDEVSIVALPGVIDTTIQEKLLSHCENMQDRFGLVDGQVAVTDFTTAQVAGGLRNSIDGYAAMYFPRIEVYDPITNNNIYVSPIGHIAGIYSRSDGERGVHKAPANEEIRGAVGLEHMLTGEDQGALNIDGVNVIRSFSGNITVWGARTYVDTSTSPEWKYINIRRLLNYIRESINDGTRWAVFEPNDLKLWQKIKRNITAFLTNVWRDGALFGTTPEEAFYVKCDEDTNPTETRDLGQVITEIGIAAVKPAEFVVFKISQWQGNNS